MKRVTYLNLIAGVWLIVASAAYDFSAGNRIAAANDAALGVLLIASSWWIVTARTALVSVSGFQLLCGVWLIIGPFLLRYRGFSPMALNDLIVGAFVAIVSVLEAWLLLRAPVNAP